VFLPAFCGCGCRTAGPNCHGNLRRSSPVSPILSYAKDLWCDTQDVSQKLPGRRCGPKEVSGFCAHPPPPPTAERMPVVRQPKSACHHPVGTRLEQKRSIEPKPLKLPVGSPRLCKCYGFPHGRALCPTNKPIASL
jgi:hypothetical protein